MLTVLIIFIESTLFGENLNFFFFHRWSRANRGTTSSVYYITRKKNHNPLSQKNVPCCWKWNEKKNCTFSTWWLYWDVSNSNEGKPEREREEEKKRLEFDECGHPLEFMSHHAKCVYKCVCDFNDRRVIHDEKIFFHFSFALIFFSLFLLFLVMCQEMKRSRKFAMSRRKYFSF